jgi:type IV fimbrial biogenesis protein FimT
MLNGGMRSWRHALGMTLVELMITVCVLAIGLALVAPSMSQQLANYRLLRAADGIFQGLSLARSEAVRRNKPVSFTLNADGTGWSVDVVSPAANVQRRSSGESPGIAATPSSAQRVVTFTPTGFVDTSTAPMSQLSITSAVANTASRRIDIFAGGLVRLCDPAVTNTSDPRGC